MAAAAAGQHIATVRVLAQAGCKVSSRDRNGTTALHVAAKAGQSAVASALLELGADPTVANDDGDTPADLARRRRDFDMVTLLGKYEAERAAAGKVDDKNANQDDRGSPGDTQGGKSPHEDDDGEEPPQVVMVSRVRQGKDVYLVDKRTGIVYSNDLDDPRAIGSWTAEQGVVLGEPTQDEDSSADDGVSAKHTEL